MADRAALAKIIRDAYSKAIDERRPADAYFDCADAVLAALLADGTIVEEWGVEGIDADVYPLGAVYQQDSNEIAWASAKEMAEHRGHEVLRPVHRTITTVTTAWAPAPEPAAAPAGTEA